MGRSAVRSSSIGMQPDARALGQLCLWSCSWQQQQPLFLIPPHPAAGTWGGCPVRPTLVMLLVKRWKCGVTGVFPWHSYICSAYLILGEAVWPCLITEWLLLTFPSFYSGIWVFRGTGNLVVILVLKDQSKYKWLFAFSWAAVHVQGVVD